MLTSARRADRRGAERGRYSRRERWQDQIVSTPEVLRGKPCVKGTRIPVSLVLGYLAAGYDAKTVIEQLPDLRQEQIAACLDYARDLAEFEVAV